MARDYARSTWELRSMHRTELEHFDARLCKRIQGFIEVPGQRASAFFPRTASQHERERVPNLAREHRRQLAEWNVRLNVRLLDAGQYP